MAPLIPHSTTPDAIAREYCARRAAEPKPPLQSPDQDAFQYGAALLQYVIAAYVDGYLYSGLARMTTADLELTEHASLYAVAAREIHPAALETIQEVRTEINKTIRSRMREQAQEQAPAPATTTIADKPNLGPMAKLIAPLPVFPPAGQKMTIEF